MPSFKDRSDSVPMHIGLEHRPMARWLLITHRIVTVVALLLAVYVVVAVIAGAVLGGHSLATRLIFLWHQIYSIWT